MELEKLCIALLQMRMLHSAAVEVLLPGGIRCWLQEDDGLPASSGSAKPSFCLHILWTSSALRSLSKTVAPAGKAYRGFGLLATLVISWMEICWSKCNISDLGEIRVEGPS